MSELGRFSCSMLDCIEQIVPSAEAIAKNHTENTAQLIEMLKKREKITHIIFVGSGTSNTSAITARNFVEKVSGITTTVLYPNDFVHNTFVYPETGLYVFTSQTGTSKVCLEGMRMIKDKGYAHVVISESKETVMAKEAECYLNMEVPYEEYPMRTVGYSASVLTQMMLGLEVGHYYGHITEEEYECYINEFKLVGSRQKNVIEKTLGWLETSKRQMLRSDLIVFTGADSLAGVALEGAVKVWETLQTASVGYELEEGMHGANFGYNSRHCVIVFNDGGRENDKAIALAKYMKEVWKNGLLVGANPIDNSDLELEVGDKFFCVIDFATVVQVIAYKTANDQGRDLFAHHDNSKMYSYFTTHQ